MPDNTPTENFAQLYKILDKTRLHSLIDNLSSLAREAEELKSRHETYAADLEELGSAADDLRDQVENTLEVLRDILRRLPDDA